MLFTVEPTDGTSSTVQTTPNGRGRPDRDTLCAALLESNRERVQQLLTPPPMASASSTSSSSSVSSRTYSYWYLNNMPQPELRHIDMRCDLSPQQRGFSASSLFYAAECFATARELAAHKIDMFKRKSSGSSGTGSAGHAHAQSPDGAQGQQQQAPYGHQIQLWPPRELARFDSKKFHGTGPWHVHPCACACTACTCT